MYRYVNLIQHWGSTSDRYEVVLSTTYDYTDTSDQQ